MAAEKGHNDCLEEMIKAGADVNIINLDGDTALMCAALTGQGHCLSTLIEAGADVNIANTDYYVPIMCFARKKDDESIKTLIEAGADVNIVNKLGETALSIAQAKDSLKCASVLVQAGAVVNEGDHYPKEERREKNSDLLNLAQKSGPDQSPGPKLEDDHNNKSGATSFVQPTAPDASELNNEFDVSNSPLHMWNSIPSCEGEILLNLNV